MSAAAFVPRRSLLLALFALAALTDFAYMSWPAWILFDSARLLLLFATVLGAAYLWSRRADAFGERSTPSRAVRGSIAFDVVGWLLFVVSLSLRARPETAFHHWLGACSLSMMGLAAVVTALWLEEFATATPETALTATAPATPATLSASAEPSSSAVQVAA